MSMVFFLPRQILIMKWHEHCHYMDLPREYSVTDLARFHGHLGPFIVLGYRMGRYALTRLGNDPFSLRAEVYCSGVTPQSCLADGVQLGSGCTLGKRNITIIPSDSISCLFISDTEHIRLTPFPLRSIPQVEPDYELEVERYAEQLFGLPDKELFSEDTA